MRDSIFSLAGAWVEPWDNGKGLPADAVDTLREMLPISMTWNNPRNCGR